MTRSQKRTLARIIISAVLLIAALIVNPPSPINLIWFLVAYAVIGYDVLLRAGQNIAGGQVFDEHLLMSIATIGVFVLAAIQHTSDYDEAVMVMLLYQVGELFQSLAVGKSRRSVAELMDIRPDYANIERDGEIVSVDPDEVEVGTEIVVRPGEQVPIDGVITQGDSALDTARLTGESVPREVSPGCEVISGCINLTGVIRVRTTKPFGEIYGSANTGSCRKFRKRKSKGGELHNALCESIHAHSRFCGSCFGGHPKYFHRGMDALDRAGAYIFSGELPMRSCHISPAELFRRDRRRVEKGYISKRRELSGSSGGCAYSGV